jgi:hypothetical protein
VIIFSNLTFNSPWLIGEWLINYAGGFVRRGLPGAFIFYAGIFSGLSPWVIAILLSIVSWLALALLLWLVCRRRFRLIFIFSPFVMLSPLIGEYLVRKDCFSLFLLGLSLLIAKPLSQAGCYSRIMRLLLINFLGAIAILSHETYVFYALPGLILVMRRFPAGRSLTALCGTTLADLLLLSPLLLVSGLCFYYHGDMQISEEIQRSWLVFSGQHPSEYPVDPMGAIGAIGWSSTYGLTYANKFILFQLANGFIWRPIALLATLYLLVLMLASPFALRDGRNLIFGKLVVKVFFVILLCMGPVFVIGHDYGRWMFMIVVATLFVSSLLSFSPASYLMPVHRSNPDLRLGGYSGSLAIFGALFLGIPPYWNSWNLAWAAQMSWIGYWLLPLSGFLQVRFTLLYISAVITGIFFLRMIRIHYNRRH